MKAMIDGLVDAGVIDDDGGRFVHFITMMPPEVGPYDGLELVIIAH